MRIDRSGVAILVLTFLPLILRAAAPEPSAEALYQEAVFKETTARDLASAVALYKKTLERPDVSRELKSNSYLRLGICYRTLGQIDQAKQVWNQVIQGFADQPAAYQEAKSRLQELKAETEKIAAVHPSTPVIVYAAPPTRWALEWLDLTFFHTLDAKGEFLNYPGNGTALNLPHSLEYYVEPFLAVGIEGRRLFSSVETFEQDSQTRDSFGFPAPDFRSVERSVAYIAPVARLEKRLPFGLMPFVKFGPAAYRFHFDGDFGSSTKWSPGITSEAGLALGWSRGFTLSLGYSLIGFVQQTPEIDQAGLHPNPSFGEGSISQARGWRWLSGPSFKLGFRW